MRICRHSSTPVAVPAAAALVAAPAAALAPPVGQPGDTAASFEVEEDLLPDGHVVTSPMVGTFYASSSPGAAAFVDVGQNVKLGDTLCIIEAMKILNHIESDVVGVVEAVLAQNSEPVEYGQPLFVIK